MTQLPIYYFSPLPYASGPMLSFITLYLAPLFLYIGNNGATSSKSLKSALGALAKGRKAKESGDSYQLREPSAPYQADCLARPRFPSQKVA